jgi:hypothetical protein
MGILPPAIRARHERADWVDKAARGGRELAKALRARYGPEMDVVLVRGGSDPDGLPDECVPNRWHVRRQNPVPEMPTYFPILGPDGTYRDPDFGVLEELAQMDLRRPEVMQRMLERTRIDAPHKRAERELRTEQRRDELRFNFKAARRVRGEGGLKRSFHRKRSGEGLAAEKQP